MDRSWGLGGSSRSVHHLTPWAAVLVTSLAVPGAATAGGGSNPDPAHISVTGHVISVSPTGVDDTANIEWAMTHVAPGGVVRLHGAEFGISESIEAINFNGKLIGWGRDETTLHLLDGFGLSELLLDKAGFEGPFGIVLYYNPDYPRNWDGQAAIALSDFTIVADGQTSTVWSNHGEPSVEVAGIYITGDLEWPVLPYVEPTGVDLTVERIGFVGTPNDNADGLHPWLTTLDWTLAVERIHGGVHRYEDLRFESTGYFILDGHYDTVVDMVDLEATDTTAFGGSIVPVRILSNGKSAITVSGLHTTHSSGVEIATGPGFFSTPTEPSVYVLDECVIDQPEGSFWGGFELRDNGGSAKSEFLLTDNTIHSDGYVFPWAPIFLGGIHGAVLSQNTIVLDGPTGDDPVGIVLRPNTAGNLVTKTRCVGCGVLVDGVGHDIVGNRFEDVPGNAVVVLGDGNTVSHDAFDGVDGNAITLYGDDNLVVHDTFKDIAGLAIDDQGTGNVTSVPHGP